MADEWTTPTMVFAYAGVARWPHRVRPGHPQDVPVPAQAGRYDISVISTEGERREHRGRLVDGVGAHVTAEVHPDQRRLTLTFHNLGESSIGYRVACSEFALDDSVLTLSVGPGMHRSLSWDLWRSFGWYDVVVTADEDPAYRSRFAGHVRRTAVGSGHSRPSGATTVDERSHTQCGSGPSSGSM